MNATALATTTTVPWVRIIIVNYNAGPLLQYVTDGRQRCADARVAGDYPGLHRDIQVFPDQDPLVTQVRVRHPQDFHDTFDHAIVVSSMRFERPHSLSYQAKTFTRVPSMTLVSDPSKIDEWGS